MGVIRIGQVNDVDIAGRTARVRYPDVNIVSGWLKIIKSPPFLQGQSVSGGSGEVSFAAHSHEVIIYPWMPEIGETVICMYGDGWNSDGYILGAL